ncbi:MAG TPA: MG2 domain-containing protein [Steroidobacteraceae bacterium]|nr:MG2 domain-containing protein [Steroidobacteraceae bacterium]
MSYRVPVTSAVASLACATLLLFISTQAAVAALELPPARSTSPVASAPPAKGTAPVSSARSVASTPPVAGAAVPAVADFRPRGSVKDARQVQARFSTDMVALGDPRVADPFVVDCPAAGQGRWIDTRAWVYDFASDLPGGLRCRFTLKPGLHDLAGQPVRTAQPYAFDTGGPAIVASLPAEGDETIDERQVFLLRLDATPDLDSIRKHARCVVAGLAESLPVVVLEGAERFAVLEQRRRLGHQYYQLLWKDGSTSLARVRDRALDVAENSLTLLRCQRPLPPDTQVQLVWGKGIATAGGVATRDDRMLAFRVRPAFTARIECTRTKPDAGCLPFKPIDVLFTSPVPRELALGLRLRTASGERVPQPVDPGRAPVLDAIRFGGPFEPSSTVHVSLPVGLVDDAGRTLTNAARFPLAVRVDELPPLAKFSGDFGILEAREGGLLPVTLRNLDAPVAGSTTAALPARRVRVGADPATIARWLRRVEDAGRPDGDWQHDAKTGKSSWRELTGSKPLFAAEDAAEAFDVPRPAGAREFEVIGIPLPGNGLHVVELQSLQLGRSLLGAERPRYVATAALVTDLAVHFKWGRESSLVWVTRLHDGKPVADATVTVADYCSGSVRWTGRTDRDGIARVREPIGDPVGGTWCDGSGPKPALVLATLGDDFSFALSSWSQGIEPWDFGLDTGSRWDLQLTHTVLDRALFRPGETVSMKHYLRSHDSSGVALAPGLPGSRKVVVQHLGSDQKFELQAPFDAGGIAEQQWTIPAGARTGDYTVTIEDEAKNARQSARFKIEDFRLPTMRAEVNGPARPLVRPASVPIDLHVAYLSGGGAGDLPVTLRTYVEPRPVHFRDYAEYVFGGEPVREGLETLGRPDEETDDDTEATGAGVAGADAVQVRPLTLDASGAARVDVRDLPPVETSAVLTAELEYADANGETLSTTSRVQLYGAAVTLGIRREGWVGTAEQLRFRVVALDLAGKPVARQRVVVSLYQATQYSYRKRLVGGFYAYESMRETTKLPVTCEGVTDSRGLLACEVAPGASGQVQIRAETRDGEGRLAGATTSAWVVGADDWWFGGTTGDRMDVLPERQEYQVGESARLQVRMPFRKATALVTVEREGVLDGYVRTLSGREPVVKVPIADGYAPNVFVSVLAVRGRLQRPEQRDGPRPERAVTATVDLYKPAFRLGTAAVRVGWQPHRLDVAVTPDRTVYGVRDKAHVAVRVRRADGKPLPAGAEVALAAVDEALLELAPNTSWQLLDAMMQSRGTEVRTATAQMQVVGKRHYGRKAVPHGGGGGRDRARQSFATLLLWQARVTLDAQGEARIEVPLNDSLSSFRIVAVASAGVDTFGTGSATIATTQDVMLMSGLPALVREGDRFLATFTVRNTSAAPRRVTLQASVEPAPAEALPAREIELPPGAARDVAWTVVVPAGSRQLTWDVTARTQDGATADRVRVTQDVSSPYPVRTYQATFAQLAGPLSWPVARPAGALPGRGGVAVELRARLADNLDGVREYMGGYPYQCLEQNLSRAIALDDRAAWDAWMQRLPAYMDGSGLLRYFPTEALPGEDTLTAYVLAVSQASGWSIPEPTRQRLVKGLQNFVDGRIVRHSALPTADLTVRKLAAIAALARHDAARASMLDSLALDVNQMPTSAVLDWLDVLRLVDGVQSRAARTVAAENALRARLTLRGTSLALSTERRDALWWLMVNTDTNAARTVLAALERATWREDVPRLVQGLLGLQQRGHWRTTTANAWAVLALQRYSAAFESVPVTGTSTVALAGQRKSVAWPSTGSKPAPVEYGWPAARASVEVTHAGTGRPWVFVQATAALPLTAPLQSGFTLQRLVQPVEQKVPGQWSRGDVARVRLQLEAQADATWVVVEDPVPAGATILGTGLGGQSRRLTEGETATGYVWPAFEERRFEAFRAYYRYVPKGAWTVEYTVRFNNPGTFQLPSTRVEAMYAPENFAESPNATLTVAAP